MPGINARAPEAMQWAVYVRLLAVGANVRAAGRRAGVCVGPRAMRGVVLLGLRRQACRSTTTLECGIAYTKTMLRIVLNTAV